MNLVEAVAKSRKYSRELRCIHRHTIEEHPQCFAKGRIKWPDDRTFEKLTENPWYQYPEYSIAYFDIETDGLFADFGTMLSWAVKVKDGPVITSVISKEELFNGTGDKKLVEELVRELSKHKIIIGYYSERFDLPFIRAKALHYGIDFPGYGELFHWDLYFTAKAKLRLTRKSLDNVCDYLGINGKTKIDKEIWRKAKYGDKEALAIVIEHNIYDVIITEKLHNKLDFTRKWLRKSI